MTTIVTRNTLASSLAPNPTNSTGVELTHDQADRNWYPLAVATNGTAEASKALVLNSSKGISGITSLTATTITGTTVNATTLATTSLDTTNLTIGGTNLVNEGPWTPLFRTTGVQPTVNTYTGSAYYHKVGKAVTIQLFIDITGWTVGSATGVIQVYGLPYTSSSSYPATIGMSCENMPISTSVYNLGARVSQSSTTIEFFGDTSTTRDFFTPSDVSTSTYIWAYGTYFTDS